jgi:hypothetical protein
MTLAPTPKERGMPTTSFIVNTLITFIFFSWAVQNTAMKRVDTQAVFGYILQPKQWMKFLFTHPC